MTRTNQGDFDMSLEAAIAENTAALKELIALTADANKARAAAMAQIAADDSGEKPARGPGRAKKETQPVAEKAKESAAEKAPATTYPTVEALRDSAKAFNQPSDEADKPARKDFMRAVIEHLGIKAREDGKTVIVDAAEEDRQNVIDWFADFAAGKKVNFQADDGPAGDDDDIG